jgi:MFS family permease
VARDVDSQERRRDIWILFVALFLFHAAVGVASPLLPRLRQVLGASYTQIGWVNAAFGVSRLLTDIPAGWLLRSRSPNLLVFVGMGIVACGNLLAASAGTVYGVIAGRAVAGFGYSAAVIGTLTLLASLATQTSRARVFSLYEFLIVAGLALSTTITGVAVEWAGWRAGFVLGALLAVLGLAAAAACLSRRTFIGMVPVPSDSRMIPRLATAGGGVGAWVVGLVLLLSFVLSYAWSGLFYTLYPLYGGEHLNLGTGAVGVAMSTGYMAELAFLFPYGWMADRFGRVPVLFAGVLLIALAAFALPLSGSKLTYMGVGLFIGVGFACWALPPAVLTDWVSSGSRGVILGLYRFMVDLGFILGPWSLSVALEQGGFRVAAWTVAAVTGAGALAFFGLRRHPVSTIPGPEAEGSGRLRV